MTGSHRADEQPSKARIAVAGALTTGALLLAPVGAAVVVAPAGVAQAAPPEGGSSVPNGPDDGTPGTGGTVRKAVIHLPNVKIVIPKVQIPLPKVRIPLPKVQIPLPKIKIIKVVLPPKKPPVVTG